MKKILLTLAVAVLAISAAEAQTAANARIYINPGHGAWTSEDRPMALVNKSAMDTTGFFESNTDLKVGLAMWEKLKEYGLTYTNSSNALLASGNKVIMSRVKNGPYPSDGNTYGAYSRALHEIAREAYDFNCDMFISIHSNAYSDGSSVNYPLILYRGTGSVGGGDAVERSSGSIAMARSMWPYLYGEEHQQWSATNTYNSTTPNIRGDVTFMGGDYSTTMNDGTVYYGYYGVLRHGRPGLLIERYFHTYQPARHRAMNWEVDYIEGYILARGLAAHYGFSSSNTKGEIYGIVRSASENFTHTYYTPMSGSVDEKLPLNGVTVTLKLNGNVVTTQRINQDGSATNVTSKTTDDFYNGAFVFRNLDPGTYTITLEKSGYTTKTINVTVTANQTTYPKVYLSPSGGSSYSYDPGTYYCNSYDNDMGMPYHPRTNYVDQPVVALDNRNAYAYDVQTSLGNTEATVKYRLSGKAQNVRIDLYREDGTLIKTVNGTVNESSNYHEVTVPMTGLPVGKYKIKVRVTGYNRDWQQVGSSFKFSQPWGVTVNTCPYSPTFGRVISVESDISTSTDNSYHSYHGSGESLAGIFAFTAQGQPYLRNGNATAANKYGFRAGLTPASSLNCASNLDFKRIKFSDDGRLFLGRTNATYSNLWEINPNNLNTSAKNMFPNTYFHSSGVGSSYGQQWTGSNSTGTFVAQPFVGMDVFGSGDNLWIYGLMMNIISSGYELHPNYAYNKSKIAIYKLGKNSTWGANAPTVQYLSHSNSGTDARYWNDQSANLAARTDMTITNQNVRTDYPRPTRTEFSGGLTYFWNRTDNNTGQAGGGIAFNRNRTKLAIATSPGVVTIYNMTMNASTSYPSASKISYSQISSHTVASTAANSITALAFDYADNLWVASAGDHTLKCWATPRSTDELEVVTPAAAVYDLNWENVEAYNPSANYYIDSVEHLWSAWNKTDTSLNSQPTTNNDNNGGWGCRTFGLTQPDSNGKRTFYFLRECSNNGLTKENKWEGFYGNQDSPYTVWAAAPSEIDPSDEYYWRDFQAASDDAGNMIFLAVRDNDYSEFLSVGNGVGMTRYLVIPHTSTAFGKASIGRTETRTFAVGDVHIPERGQFISATGDFTSSGGGSVWILPYGGQNIYKGTLRNVSLSGGEVLSGQVIPTGLSNANGTDQLSKSYLNSVSPYGENRALVCLFNQALYDGYFKDGRFVAKQITNNARHAQGKPSIFMIQDRKLLVCSAGTDSYGTMGLFEVTNTAGTSPTYSIQQARKIVDDTNEQIPTFAPFGNEVSGKICNSLTKGTITKPMYVDDLTTDIYCYTNQDGYSLFRIKVKPTPVRTVAVENLNRTTSQAKRITWTTATNTSAKSFIIEVSTDNGSTWSNLTNVDNNYVVGPQTYNFVDEDQTRALKDCKYRVMAVYDSFTEEGTTHTADGKESNTSHIRPSKKVSNITLTFVPRKAPSAYNPNEDLACLDGVYTFERPKAIDSDENYFPTNDYGFNVSRYRLWIRNTTSPGYAQNASGESLSDIDMTPDNAVSTYGCTTFNSNTVSVPVKGLKRGDNYNCTVQVFYDYVPTTTHIGTGDEWLRSQSWNYTPNPVNQFEVENYVKRNAVVREYWQEDNQYHDVTYDIYQVHLWMNDPSIAYADGVQIPVSYHKLEVSKDGGTTWEPLQDFVPQNSPQSNTYPYPAHANVPAGCFQGNNAFRSNKRTNPDGNFQYLVNVGFYYYVYKGNSVHSNRYSPKSVDNETPENWQYRITSYYGSTPSVTYSGTAYNPSSYNLNQSAYADATVKPTEVTGVDEIERDGLFQVMVYPNPTQGAMTVQSPEPIQTIRIMTISGALIKTFNGSNGPSQMIDLSDIPVGNYFVIVNNQKPVHVIRK